VLIANKFLRSFSLEEGKQFIRISAAASQSILSYPWPGNVRELANVLRRVVVMHDGPVVEFDMLPDTIRKSQANSPSPSNPAASLADSSEMSVQSETTIIEHSWVPEGKTLANLEREIIEATIDRCQGNISEAAVTLGVSPSTLYRKRSSWQR
jgi:two-component system repressor protein LuxO